MEDDLHSAIANNAGVAALVGGTGTSARVYPLVRKQTAPVPAVTYQVIDRPRINTASMTGNNARVNSRVQIDSWARTYAEVKALAAAVKTAVLASSITAISLDERDLYEPDTELYRVSADFSTWHLEV